MPSKEEKLSLLTDMITLAKADSELKNVEYNFLLSVSKQIGVSKEDLDDLFNNPAPHKPIASETERLVQFHRLLLLMNVDKEIKPEELNTLHQFGLKMGLNPLAINKVLDVMHDYEDKIIPPQVLVDIFKTYYN